MNEKLQFIVYKYSKTIGGQKYAELLSRGLELLCRIRSEPRTRQRYLEYRFGTSDTLIIIVHNY